VNGIKIPREMAMTKAATKISIKYVSDKMNLNGIEQ
jgi:hypothetical protein